MSDLRNYLAFMIFLNDYWLEEQSIADLTSDEISAYYDLWQHKWLPKRDSAHSGDCIKLPAPCVRCHLDAIFKDTDKILEVLGRNKNITRL